MKKSYVFLLSLVAWALGSEAQTKVTFRVNMKNETVSANGVHIPGNYQAAAGMPGDWNPGEALAEAKDPDNDKVYELEVNIPPGVYEYKFVNGNDWGGGESVPSSCNKGGNREVVVGSNDLVLDIVCFSSCTNCASTIFERNVKFMVIDSNSKFTDVKIKGAFSGWADIQAYDDGTNGDVTAGDKIFTSVYKVKDGEYEWGATNKGSWIIQGPNRKFKMDLDGKITGDTTYGVPKLGALIDVTFSVDMSNETVSSSGVYVSGNFLESLESPIGNWDKDTIKMQPRTTGSDIYTVTVKLYAGKFAYKYWNGVDKVDSDKPAENYDFTSNGCGEPNGVGGHNRVLALAGVKTNTVLPTYKFNSCGVSATVSKIGTLKFGIMPNPAQDRVNLTFKNNASIAQVTVTDLTGRVVLTQSVTSNTAEINLEGLSKGVYTLTAFDVDGSYGVQKLVKN